MELLWGIEFIREMEYSIVLDLKPIYGGSMIYWKRIYLNKPIELPLHNFGLTIKHGEGYIDVWKNVKRY